MVSSMHVLRSALLTLLGGQLGALAQLAGTPPQCALSCVVSTSYQGCATADTRCLCTTPAAVTGVQACIQSKCTSQSDRTAAVAFVQQECQSLTASPSGTAPGSTKTVSSASEATNASFGNAGSPRVLPDQSIVSRLVAVVLIVVLVPSWQLLV